MNINKFFHNKTNTSTNKAKKEKRRKKAESRAGLDNGAHSKYLLLYHVIWVVKYKQGIFTREIGERLKAILSDLIISSGCQFDAMEVEIDHVHILLRAKPIHQISKLLHTFKGVSARLLFIEYPGLRNRLRRGSLWSRSYYVSTVGKVDQETVRKYIETQHER